MSHHMLRATYIHHCGRPRPTTTFGHGILRTATGTIATLATRTATTTTRWLSGAFVELGHPLLS